MTSEEELSGIVASLGPDEHRVMLVLARRLAAGQRQYGRLDLASDVRDWALERSLEIQDLLIYSAFEALKHGRDL
jgi:hypothetical protein